MLTAKQQHLTAPENDRLLAILAGGATYTAAARAFTIETGKQVSINTVSRLSRRNGVKRNAPKTDGRVREILHDGFSRQRTTRTIMRDVLLKTGVSLSKWTVAYHRDTWLAKGGAVVTTECDLCGTKDGGERFRGGSWGLEGLVCGRCRAELMEETQQRRQDRKAADRRQATPGDRPAPRFEKFLAWEPQRTDPNHGVYMTRAKVIRAGVFGLPILDPYFTADNLRGRAFTHWLKATLRRDPSRLLMMAG